MAIYNPLNVRVGPKDPDLVRGPDINHGYEEPKKLEVFLP